MLNMGTTQSNQIGLKLLLVQNHKSKFNRKMK